MKKHSCSHCKHQKDKNKKHKPGKAPKGEPSKKKAITNAMNHKDVLGAGAKKRRHLGKKNKVETVMKEFKRGTLNSGSGAKVTNRKQAVAIALSEARRGKK